MNIIYFYNPVQSETTAAENIINSITLGSSDSIIRIDITKDSSISRVYSDSTPLVEVGPYHLRFPFSRQEIEIAINAARDRLNQVQDGSDEAKRIDKGSKISKGDLIAHWFSKNYIWVFNGFVFIYLLLPFLAPIFSKYGLVQPAKVIHKIYSPICHQLAFRSWFIFGEQPIYPRDLAGITGIKSYEEISGQQFIDLERARQFIGNEEIGFKVALCQRDVAIYGSILLFGLVFAFTGRRIKPLPWYWWVIVGMVPIGIDGFSQLPSLLLNGLPPWLLERESTPLLRTITGVLFGITTMWYMYPLIEETMQDTRSVIATKIAVISQKSKQA